MERPGGVGYGVGVGAGGAKLAGSLDEWNSVGSSYLYGGLNQSGNADSSGVGGEEGGLSVQPTTDQGDKKVRQQVQS